MFCEKRMDSINVHLRTLCITWPKFSPKHIWKHLHIVRCFTDCAILFLKQIVLWFSFLVHSWPICRKSLKIFHNTKYIFLEVAGVIIYLWRCTAEKASLYLTCVKNIIIEGREGFNGLLLHHLIIVIFSQLKCFNNYP